jgi:hypothetical protein
MADWELRWVTLTNPFEIGNGKSDSKSRPEQGDGLGRRIFLQYFLVLPGSAGTRQLGGRLIPRTANSNGLRGAI